MVEHTRTYTNTQTDVLIIAETRFRSQKWDLFGGSASKQLKHGPRKRPHGPCKQTEDPKTSLGILAAPDTPPDLSCVFCH